VEAAIQAGATTINIPDTVGYAMQDEFANFIKNILDEKNVRSIGKVTLSVHCHDDLGMAVANSLTAVEAGAGRQLHCFCRQPGFSSDLPKQRMPGCTP